MAVGYLLFLIEVARLVAGGNTRLVSLAVLLVLAALAAHAKPLTILLALVAVSPLPLYMQGLHASLTPAVVGGVGLALALAAQRGLSATGVKPAQAYAWPLFAVVGTTLVSFMRGASDRSGADLGGLARLLVGLAIFCACLVCIRSVEDLKKAYAALGAAGAVVLLITIVQLTATSVQFPGLLSGVGSVQTAESGLASNLRVGGPVGDYELLGELFALAGVVAMFFALRSRGAGRLLWGAMVAAFFVGIATTSTRSSFVVLAAGILLTLLANSFMRGEGLGRTWVVVSGSVLLAVPLLTVLQQNLRTGYLIQRLEATNFGGGLTRLLDRSGVWAYFMNRLPHGSSLYLGSGPSFDYQTFQTYPHSLPLTLVFTVGVVGAVAFYCLLGVILWRCARLWLRHRDPYAFLGALLVTLFVINELKIEYLRTYNYQWFVWALLGICAASSLGLSRVSEPAPIPSPSPRPLT